MGVNGQADGHVTQDRRALKAPLSKHLTSVSLSRPSSKREQNNIPGEPWVVGLVYSDELSRVVSKPKDNSENTKQTRRVPAREGLWAPLGLPSAAPCPADAEQARHVAATYALHLGHAVCCAAPRPEEVYGDF